MFEGLLNKDGAGTAAGPTRAISNAELRRVVGQRLVEARNLNGWNQSTGAERLGYRNSTQLNLWEQGKREIPLTMLRHASTVYGVSIDYLMGMSDEPDRDPKQAERRAVLRQVYSLLELNASVITEAVFDCVADGAPTAQTTRTVLEELRNLVGAGTEFHARNAKRFESSMPGGSLLLKRLGSAQSLVRQVDALMNRHDNFARRAIAAARERWAHARRRAAAHLRHVVAMSGGVSTEPDQYPLGLDVQRPAANEEKAL